MSDWTAVHSTVASAVSGLDMEMPYAFYFSQWALQSALNDSSLSLAAINDKALRVLTSMYAAGLFDRVPSGDPNANVTSPAHNALARELAAETTVLLKNNGAALPLSPALTIAVIGDACDVAPIVAGT